MSTVESCCVWDSAGPEGYTLAVEHGSPALRSQRREPHQSPIFLSGRVGEAAHPLSHPYCYDSPTLGVNTPVLHHTLPNIPQHTREPNPNPLFLTLRVREAAHPLSQPNGRDCLELGGKNPVFVHKSADTPQHTREPNPNSPLPNPEVARNNTPRNTAHQPESPALGR